MWRVTIPLASSVEATRTVTISALDAASQTTTTSFTLNIDTLGPRTSLTQPAMGVVVGAMTTLQGTALDPAMPIMLVTVDVGAGPQMATIGPGGTWQVSMSYPPNLNRVTRQVTISALDSLGNQSVQAAQVLVDTQGPALVLTNPSNTTVVGASTTLTGTATDSTGPVSGMTIDVGSGPAPVTVQANGAWSLAVTFPPNLDRVSRTVTLRAQDSVGNVTVTTAQVLVDTRGPTLAFSAPAVMERLGNPRTQAVTGTVSDSTGVSSVVMNCGDSGGNRPATVTSGSWSVSWPLPTADNSTFTCTTTATDSLSNQTVLTRSFSVDTVAPVVNLTAPAASAVLGGSSTTMVVQASVTDGSNQFSAVNATFGAATLPATGSGNTYSATFNLPIVDFQPVNVSFIATDAEGNSAGVNRTVTVDKVAPVVTITAPTAGQQFNIGSFTNSSSVVVTWAVTDGDASAGTRQVQGANVAPSLRSTSVATSSTDNRVTYSQTVDAVDTAGNVSALASVSFTVDRVAPSVTVFPANGSRNNTASKARLTFSESVMAPSGVSPDRLRLNGSTVSGSWTSQTVYESPDLPGGTAYAAVVQGGLTDLSGNPVAPVSWQFHRAPTLPSSSSLIVAGAGPWDVATDDDGQPTIAYVSDLANQPGQTMTLDGQTGAWRSASGADGGLGLPVRSVYSDISINAWGVVDSSLSMLRTRTVSASTGESTYHQDGWMTDTAQPFFAYLIPTPPIHPLDGSEWYGTVSGNSYTRAAVGSRALPFSPQRIVTSPNGWFGFANAANGTLSVMTWSCKSSPLTPFACAASPLMTSPEQSQGLNFVSAAISSTGCGVVAYTTPSARRAATFGFSSGVDISGNFASTGVAPLFSVARRKAGGLWVAYQTATTALTTTISIMHAPSCSLNPSSFVFVKSVIIPGAWKAQVVELGTTVGLVYQPSDFGLYVAY